MKGDVSSPASRAEEFRTARKLDPGILGRIIRLVLQYKARVAIAFAATLASSLFQLFIPRYVGQAVDNAQGLLGADSAPSSDIETALWLAASMILILSMLRGLFAVVQNYFGESLDHCIAAELRKAFFQRIQQLDLTFHDHSHSGDLITRGMLDLEGIRHFPSTGLVRTLLLLVLVTGGTVLLLSTNLVLGLIALSFVPVIAVRSAIARIQLRYLWLKQQERLTALTNAMEENLTGIRVVRAFAAQAYELAQFDQLSTKVLEISYQRLMARVRSMTFMGFAFYSAMTAVLWAGGSKVLAGEITIGTLTEFLAFMMILHMPVRQIGMTVNSYARASTCGARFFAILDRQNAVEEGDAVRNLEVPRGEIQFEDVAFSYTDQPDESQIISGITFKIGPGRTLGIVGPPGSGKSTIARLIPRFYDATAGRILIDGQDIRYVTLASLRRAIGGVQQDSFLFTASVDNNIAYGDPWSGSDAIVQASRDAQLHEFVATLPETYQTLVGEQGVSLSGGQRQRVSIARGTLTNAPICIFDDATAAIDAGTEQQIRSALAQRSGKRTTIIISHRLISVMHADEILFLDEGRIVERGSHDQLLSLNGRYAALHSLQMQGAGSAEWSSGQPLPA
ncbi:MAG: ABC transporter ATP-binding protein [Pseudomonadota bacterium]|nr:ABC transporter ATP-binding protein [Pseudomonadota bacterium]